MRSRAAVARTPEPSGLGSPPRKESNFAGIKKLLDAEAVYYCILHQHAPESASSPRFNCLKFEGQEAVFASDGSLSTEWLDLDAMNAAGGAPHYVRRDFLGVGDLGTLVADPHANQSRHNPRFWPMPAHQRLRVTPFDDTHFQCAFSPMWPGKVAGWKMPPNGDCRDLLSLNAIQAMLGRICNSRIDRIGRH